jgi:hypothetical protein
MPILNTAQLLRWGCPVSLAASPPQKDTDGSRLLLYVVDTAGNNFEVRCVPTLTSFYYSFLLSLPNGSETEISRCIYSVGLNGLSIVYTGTKTETLSPTGTPVINVGSLKVVQHTNKEATGNAFTPLKPKVGGADFHMVYDFTRKFRYRINTKIGKGGRGRGTSTDYFCASLPADQDSVVCRGEAQPIEGRLDLLTVQETDTAFRCFDDETAVEPGDRYEHQCIDTDDEPLGYSVLEDESRIGGIVLDQGLCGAILDTTQTGIPASMPPRHGRTLATLALETTLLPGYHAGAAISVEIDGHRLPDIDVKPTGSMVALQFPLDAASRFVEIGCAGGKTVYT